MRLGIVVLLAAGLAGCGDPVRPTPPPCDASYLATGTTAIIVAGRSAPLIDTAAYVALTPTQAPVSWKSSNTGVVAIVGDEIQGKSAGTAQLTATSCNLTEVVSARVIPTGYALTFLPEQFSATGFSDSGHVVGQIGTENWLWRDGVLTSLGDCRPVDVNDFGVVVCAGTGPRTWQDGAATVRDTSALEARAINDSGHVLLAPTVTGAAWRWISPEARVNAGSFLYGTAMGLNNRGDAIGLGGDALYPDGSLYRADGTRHSLGGFGRWSHALSLNDNGDVAGRAEHMSGGGQRPVAVWWRWPSYEPAMLRSFAGSGPANAVAEDAVGINDARQVIANGRHGGVLYSEGRLGLLTYMLADPQWSVTVARHINNRGQIVASVQNTATMQTRLALLSPP